MLTNVYRLFAFVLTAPSKVSLLVPASQLVLSNLAHHQEHVVLVLAVHHLRAWLVQDRVQHHQHPMDVALHLRMAVSLDPRPQEVAVSNVQCHRAHMAVDLNALPTCPPQELREGATQRATFASDE